MVSLTRKYNPEGSALRRDQTELLRILKVLAKICDDNGIQWWLSSGTLLGAARHQGFIPWDDALAIVMMKEDYHKLEKILLQMQSEDFVFHCTKTDVEYINLFGKFRKRDGEVMMDKRRHAYYKWKGLCVDIFAIEKTSYISARLSKIFYHPVLSLVSRIKVGWIRQSFTRLVQYCNWGFIFPVLRLIGLINPSGQYHYALGQGWPRHVFYAKDIFPLSVMEFEGEQYPVPHDVDSYLTNVYGDWRKIPSEEEIKKAIHCQEYKEEIFGKEQ